MIRLVIYDAMGMIRPKYETAIRALQSDNDIIHRTIEESISAFSYEHRYLDPTHAVCVFEGQGTTWRHQLYEGYKANREPSPKVLNLCLPSIKARLSTMGVTSVAVQNIEADDVVATIASKADKNNIKTFVVSSDKDFNALISQNVVIRDHRKKIIRNLKWLEHHFDLLPHQFTDYLALVGDSVDNIPGLPGVGGKKAPILLKQFGSVDNIIAQSDYIKGKTGENVRKNKALLKLSLQLVTLKCDVDVGINLADLSLSRRLGRAFCANPNESI